MSCLGNDVESLWKGLREGRPDFRVLDRIETSKFRFTHGGQAWHFELDASEDAPDPGCQFMAAAGGEALRQAGLGDQAADVGLVTATNFGPALSIERYMEALHAGGAGQAGALFPKCCFSNDVDEVCRTLGLGGPRSSISLSCASGNAAIGYAVDLIRSGKAEAVLAGGYDAITTYTWTGLSSLRVINASKDEPDKVKPFDKTRKGTLFSEGAGVLLLESLDSAQSRGVGLLAEVLGHAMNNNAFHMARASKEGTGTANVMRGALGEAEVAPKDVDYVNAHGTGTQGNDPVETAAIKTLLGDHAYEIVVSSNKSVVGHGMGAASSFEAISTIHTLREGVVPPTINLHDPDPECDLNYVPNEKVERDVRIALSNSAGIGGCNAAVVFGRFEP